MHIDVRDREIEIDGKVLAFPASYDEVKEILGEASRIVPSRHECPNYVYDDLGIVVNGTVVARMRKQKSFVDKDHLITSVYLILHEEDVFHGDPVPAQAFDGSVTIFSRPVAGLRHSWGFERHFFTNEAAERVLSATTTCIKGNDEVENIVNGKLNRSLVIDFDPERPKSTENYNPVKLEEPVLSFRSFNFKLAVIQELMYNQELIKPYFDIYDYLEFKKSRANTETEKNIKAAVKFFQDYEIPASCAANIETITMDGGNDIYGQIAPLWDGEDGRFDIDELVA